MMTIGPIDRISTFLNTVACKVAENDSAIAKKISCGLRQADLHQCRVPIKSGNTPSIYDDLSACATDAVSQGLLDCFEHLHWRQAGFGKLPAHLSQKILVSELIGPDALVLDTELRCGLLIQYEGVEYPRHQHAAEELYLIIHGTAYWSVDDREALPRSPGSFVHHSSWQPHSVTSRRTSLIAFWGWMGDIDSSTYSV